MKKLTAAVLALIIFLIPCLVSCDQAEEHPYVVISRANVILSVGDEYTLGAKVYPEKYSDLEIEWSTSNADVVSCDGGKLKAKSAGSSVIMASVNGGNAFTATVNVNDGVRGHINLIVGESTSIPTSLHQNIFAGEFDWISSDPEVVACDGGVVTAKAAGDVLVRISQGDDLVSICTVSAFESIEAMVDFQAPELPVSMSYLSGQSELEVQDFTYTITEDSRGLLVTFTITYKKTADISGTDSKNRTGFYIELYSDEVGYCTTYKAVSDSLFVGQTATFRTNFYADVSNGMRHFNIKLVPIDN